MLLESTLPSRLQHRSFLFQKPIRVFAVQDASELPAFFAAVESARSDGHYLAGYLTYELGCLLQEEAMRPLPAGRCLAKLGVYHPPSIFDHLARHETADPPRKRGDLLDLAMLPAISSGEYGNRLRRIREYIEAGDTYQVNFTTAMLSRFQGDLLYAYERIAWEQPCSYAAALRLDADRTLLSFSPELFFQIDCEGGVTTRPMKGTAANSASGGAENSVSNGEARSASEALQADEKNRAEHVMIVDLLRNDLGRICETGSVRVDDLFHVEQYPTVHQMVSTVHGRLRKGIAWREIFAGLFPSGSITGAPKRRTMQILHELEAAPRDVYTGAIGYIAPSGESAFSVAIRTLEFQHTRDAYTVRMGVGGGIVADSTAGEEWQECLLKTSFLQQSGKPLQIVETMRMENGTVPHYGLHRRRLLGTAETLGFHADASTIDAAVRRAAAHEREPQRLRLTVDRDGAISTRCEPLQAWRDRLCVRIAPVRTDAADPALRYKTTSRGLYDASFREAQRDGYDEAIFLNSRGELTEGCVTNLLLFTEEGLLTPLTSCGVLPGVYRQMLLDLGLANERLLALDALRSTQALFLCNSLRGIMRVHSVALEDGSTITYDEGNAICLQRDLLCKVAMPDFLL